MRLIILAAGRGSRLRPLTDDTPKAMVPLHGRPLIEWQVRSARRAGLDEIAVVTGYRANQIDLPGVEQFHNPDYDQTNMVVSLWEARSAFGDGCVVSYGDIVYSPSVLRALLEASDPVSVIIDKSWRPYWQRRFGKVLEDAESLKMDDDGVIRSIGQPPGELDEIEGQYVGLTAFREAGVERLREAYETARQADREGERPFRGPRRLNDMYMTDLLQGMVKREAAVGAVPVKGSWLEIDTPEDLRLANRLTRVAGNELIIER